MNKSHKAGTKNQETKNFLWLDNLDVRELSVIWNLTR